MYLVCILYTIHTQLNIHTHICKFMFRYLCRYRHTHVHTYVHTHTHTRQEHPLLQELEFLRCVWRVFRRGPVSFSYFLCGPCSLNVLLCWAYGFSAVKYFFSVLFDHKWKKENKQIVQKSFKLFCITFRYLKFCCWEVTIFKICICASFSN